MLGDIHLFQYLNEEKTIAYSSSVVQQNFGESIEGHGYLIWDTTTDTHEFIQVDNSFIFINAIIENGKLINEIEFNKYQYNYNYMIIQFYLFKYFYKTNFNMCFI